MEIDSKLVEVLSGEYQTAAQVLAVLAGLRPGSLITISEIVRLSSIAHIKRSEVHKVLSVFETFGVTGLQEDSYKQVYSQRSLRDLMAAVIGAQIYKTIADAKISHERPSIVLTRPRAPSRLDSAISDDESLHVNIEETSHAFASLAASAQESLTIMTPFLDDSGADWAMSLFNITHARVRKYLILRFLSEPKSDWYPVAYDSIRSRLHEIGVEVYDFAVPREGSPDFYETFHAKVICADGCRAYVGSANLNRHSREGSMELGILVAGTVAQRVDGILGKVRLIARKQRD